MKTPKSVLSVAAGLALIAPLAVAGSPATAAPESLAELTMAAADGIAGKYIVLLKEAPEARSGMSIAHATESVAAVAQTQGATVTDTFTGIGGFAAELNADQIAALRKDPRVESIAQDRVVSLPKHDVSEDHSATAVGSWGIDRINQPDLPLDDKYTAPGKQGRGVHVYVIDTGVSAHREYRGRLSSGYDVIDNDYDAEDCQGHGTHVAGTVAGKDVGVAPQATLHGVRVLGCDGIGSAAGVIKGIDWVARNAIKPAVANLSLGGPKSTVENNAMTRLVNAGVTSAVAAGNDGKDACNFSPGSAAAALTIGNSNRYDRRSATSNWGRCVDLFAPGSDIRSGWYTGGYRTISGTSMAAPHVAGAAALILGENPNASTAGVERTIKNNAVRNKISDTKGSPNLLLQVGPGGGDDDDDDDDVNPGTYENTERKTVRNYGSGTSLRSTTSGAKKLTLSINMSHACANHLKIDLTTPDGVKNTVKRSSYASGRRCFSWNGFKSETYDMRSKSNGSWTLTVADDYSGASGTLNGWKIKLF